MHPVATVKKRVEELIAQSWKASGKSADEWGKEATVKDEPRRLGTPEDIAALTLFLSSERARHVQSTAIAVDGGSTVGYY